MLLLVIVSLVSTVGWLLWEKIVLFSGNVPKDKKLITFHQKPLNFTNPSMQYTITLNITQTFNWMIRFQELSSISKTRINGKLSLHKS
jgi:predicted PurR-regulated permease PerM